MIIQRMTTPQPTSSADSLTLNGVTLLAHLGVIKITGEDAAKFIHNQLTQDFSLLDLHTARLAAFCSPKGRVLASFIGFKRSQQEILLICSQDILAATLKRLSMFVMRAKAQLTDATSEFELFGLAGNATKSIADGPWLTGATTEFNGGTLVNLSPADGTPRQMVVAPTSNSTPVGTNLSIDTWLWGEVRSGVATVSAAVADAFVPQMLNYESVGGVNFKKGCYPGQEVVARSQFRGTLKRRAALAHADVPMSAGDEIFVAQDNSQPVATVVQASSAPGGGFDAIISGQIAAMEASPLHLKSSAGPVLFLLPLPYRLLDDI